MKLLIAIINHSLNSRALALKASLSRYASVVAIDSGSVLTEAERAGFDICLPNVYFAGCVRAAVSCATNGGYTHLWVWASDVDCSRMADAVRRCTYVLSLPYAGVYAPSATYSFHRQMIPCRGRGLKRVSFTDGFCFAGRVDLFQQVAFDFRSGRFGFGLDIHLGYLARRSGLGVFVDHSYRVNHPQGAGYSVNQASDEWYRWRRRQPLAARLFHALAKRRLFKTSLGMWLLLSFPWGTGMHPWTGYQTRWVGRQKRVLAGISPEA
jgi:hypothetical protein